MQIIEVPPRNQDVKRLFKLLDEHNLSHCPSGICNLIQPQEMENIKSVLLGIFFEERLCGIGGLKYFDAYAEVTRMYLLEEYRGRGFAERLLKALEKQAIRNNLTKLKLETSDKFERAIRLYLRHGFIKCEPFGEYVNKPYNTYMEMELHD